MPLPGQKLRFRRDTAARWVSVNPVLADGEPGYERDTGCLKIGDGSTPWTDLTYFAPEEEVEAPAGPTPVTPVPMEPLETIFFDHVSNPIDPHPLYDDGRDFFLLYENAKV